MSRRRFLGIDVFEAAVQRAERLYREGHRLVLSFSAGKDSGVCLEVMIVAATRAGRLPVDVVMRDEEVMYPGTYEYAERCAARPEVNFHWVYAGQPVMNIYNRPSPYFWPFDPLVKPDDWVRKPPAIAYKIPELNIDSMNTPARFPPAPGKDLMSVIGMRIDESKGRRFGLFSSGGYVTKPHRHGVRHVWLIYDWNDGDVWKAINDGKWDYNRAYDDMHRLGVPRRRLRIAPPTMTAIGADSLKMAAQAWPQWFTKVCRRLPGVRQVALFGRRAVEPERRMNETWEQCFQRLCIDTAPKWIADRAERARAVYQKEHAHHSTTPLPEQTSCQHCTKDVGCWKKLTLALYGGDPFSQRIQQLPYVEPEFFRPGAGTWGGSPSF